MNEIYQATDLATRRREFLDEAREGRARVRLSDGVEVVALPARDLKVLEQLAYWSNQHRRLAVLLARPEAPSLLDLGDLAWLRVFDREDLLAFADDLQNALIAAFADSDTAVLDSEVHAWKVTGQQLQDPLRRSVLTSRLSRGDFVDAGTNVDDGTGAEE
jgi:hypothetical protein